MAPSDTPPAGRTWPDPAQPGAAMLAGGGCIGLLEDLEQPTDRFFAQARAAVLDLKAQAQRRVGLPAAPLEVGHEHHFAPQATATLSQTTMAPGDAATLTIAGEVAATWKSAKPSLRFDSSAFKAAQPETYSQFCRPVESRRFLIKESK